MTLSASSPEPSSRATGTGGASAPLPSWPPLKDGVRRFAKTGQKAARILQVNALGAVRAVPALRNALHLPRNRMAETVSSAADGVRIHRVAPEERYERALPRMPGETEVHEIFRREHRGTYHPTFVAELNRGRIWCNYGGSVFTRNGHLIPDLSKDIWGPRLHSALASVRLPSPEWLPGRTLSLVTPEASGNYHHWMMDLLPRLGFLERAGFSPRDFDHVLVKYRALPFQKESLRRCGIEEARIRVVNDDTHIEAETLVVPSLHLADVRVPPADMRYVRRVFLPQEPRPGTAWRRLYVGRADAAYRKVTNADGLAKLLAKYRFEEVAMSRYSLEEGAKLFSEAAVVMGPNGSALANLLFAHPECRVVEFFAPGWVVCYNWMIAANLGLDFTALIGRGERPPPGTLPQELKADIDLDLDQLEDVLRGIAPAS